MATLCQLTQKEMTEADSQREVRYAHHALGVCDKVGGDVAAVKLHALHNIQVVLRCPALFHGHHSLPAHAAHRVADQLPNLRAGVHNTSFHARSQAHEDHPDKLSSIIKTRQVSRNTAVQRAKWFRELQKQWGLAGQGKFHSITMLKESMHTHRPKLEQHKSSANLHQVSAIPTFTHHALSLSYSFPSAGIIIVF